MFRVIRSLYGVGTRAKTAQKTSKPRKRLQIRFDLLEDRVTPAAFTPGDLAIYRVGDGSVALAATGNAVFVDEYTPGGTLVQSIALPSTGGGNKLIASGTATSE